MWGFSATKDVTIRNLSTKLLVTPNVREWAAQQFGCDKINNDAESD